MESPNFDSKQKIGLMVDCTLLLVEVIVSIFAVFLGNQIISSFIFNFNETIRQENIWYLVAAIALFFIFPICIAGIRRYSTPLTTVSFEFELRRLLFNALVLSLLCFLDAARVCFVDEEPAGRLEFTALSCTFVALAGFALLAFFREQSVRSKKQSQLILKAAGCAVKACELYENINESESESGAQSKLDKSKLNSDELNQSEFDSRK